MNFKRNRRGHSAVEASALSDILFFLLLFFLIISTLASPNAIKLLLPKSSTGQNISRQVINISINSKLDYYIERKKVDMNNLPAELTIQARKHEAPSVVLRVDKSVSVEELVKVVDAVNQLKLPLVIATEKSK